MKHPGLINKSTADQPDSFEWTKESLDKIKASIGFLTQSIFLTAGTGGAFKGRCDQ